MLRQVYKKCYSKIDSILAGWKVVLLCPVIREFSDEVYFFKGDRATPTYTHGSR
jgi:hypothetical protein